PRSPASWLLRSDVLCDYGAEYTGPALVRSQSEHPSLFPGQVAADQFGAQLARAGVEYRDAVGQQAFVQTGAGIQVVHRAAVAERLLVALHRGVAQLVEDFLAQAGNQHAVLAAEALDR